MLSARRWPHSCANFANHEFAITTPFHFFHLPNTNTNTLKFSPHLHLEQNPRHHNRSKNFFSKRDEQVTRDAPFSQGFSALQDLETPWDSGNIWSTLALYLFTLHIPLSFGGLSVVSLLSRQPHLDPELEALSLLTIQILEFYGALILLKYTAKPHHKFEFFFQSNKLLNGRNWFLASVVGFGFLVLLVFLTSLLPDSLFASKPVNNSILKEMLLKSDVSRVSCVLVYCMFTPLIEEVVYRGFLLTSLSSTMEWHKAVTISSVIFSTIHFSGENFLQLFIIGFVLGCSYCWSGNLTSSIAIHSLYNALTLIITYFY